MNELHKQKTNLRSELLERRRGLAPETQAAWDKKIEQTFLSSISYRYSDIVLIYSSLEKEVSTLGIIKRALSDGKAVACPVSDKGTNTLTFRIIRGNEDFVAGSYGIFEPKEENPGYLEYAETVKEKKNPLAICAVPCLSYDSEGYRIGYGKGYYDRFLSGFEGTKIGLCYSSFMEKSLPRGKFDIKLDVVVTEKGVATFK